MAELEESSNRAYTEDEVITLFIEEIWNRVSFWERAQRNGNEHAISGMAFSILTLLDGMSSSSLPGIELVLRPHPDDKEYHLSEGRNYFKDGMCFNSDVYLHENFYVEEENESN